jgi:hypothetical protein
MNNMDFWRLVRNKMNSSIFPDELVTEVEILARDITSLPRFENVPPLNSVGKVVPTPPPPITTRNESLYESKTIDLNIVMKKNNLVCNEIVLVNQGSNSVASFLPSVGNNGVCQQEP